MTHSQHLLAPALLLLTFAYVNRLAGQSLYTLPEGVETRWASPENPTGEKGSAAQTNSGRKGRPMIPIKAGEQVTLADVRGRSGTVRRIWITIFDRRPAMLRGLKIEMFWDGSSKPAVSAPFGDFFGMGSGRVASFESALFATAEGKSFNCYIPMPFRTGMKIVVTNESGKDLLAFYYDVDYTLGDKHDASDLYFHAHFRRENPTTMQQDFEILPETTGKGRYLGATFSVQANQQLYAGNWWGEGEVKIYLDGDRDHPTLAGTGTEDYVGSGWGLGRFSNRYSGCTFADLKKLEFAFYRYHVLDPIYFRDSVRVTIQQIGYTLDPKNEDAMYKAGPVYKAGAGHVERVKRSQVGYFERQDDWSAVAYYYLDKADDDAPPLQSAEERMKGMSWTGPTLADAPLQ